MNYSEPSLRRALSAEYALGTMPAPARRRFERLLQDDRALQEEVAQWQDTLATLTAPLSLQQPPERVWQAISARLQPQRKASRRPMWQWLAGGLAMLSLVMVVMFTLQKTEAPVYLASLQSESAVTALTVSARGDAIEIRPLATTPVAANQSLELWIVPVQGKPISLGVVPTQGSKRIALTPAQQREIGERTLLAVTLEPYGGSPTAAPTGPILYKGYLGLARS
ncbi:anti-sigma factor domain-containing protein [Herbaspirillum chlorophenolicum]|uniref:Regulator of SigK n=1 Tax=Herbaspirillum chlorophenolicum TaxID=211589 RepID=A0ABW8F171_9BURK